VVIFVAISNLFGSTQIPNATPMGSYLPCKKSPFGHLSGIVILLMGGDCLSHVITVVGVVLINIAIF